MSALWCVTRKPSDRIWRRRTKELSEVFSGIYLGNPRHQCFGQVISVRGNRDAHARFKEIVSARRTNISERNGGMRGRDEFGHFGRCAELYRDSVRNESDIDANWLNNGPLVMLPAQKDQTSPSSEIGAHLRLRASFEVRFPSQSNFRQQRCRSWTEKRQCRHHGANYERARPQRNHAESGSKTETGDEPLAQD